MRWSRVNLDMVLFGLLVMINIGCVDAWFNQPSFTSAWIYLEAQNTVHTTDPIVVNHNFGEYPAKVDVQIKVNRSGEDIIFSGFGSAQRDDDDYNNDAPYGGVVYIYNQNTVLLHYPVGSQAGSFTATGGVAYTGGSEFDGPFHSFFTSGHIRVRAWKLCDLPKPSFSQFSNTMGDRSPVYLDIGHNLGVYPDFVVVQITTQDDYISEAQGTTFQDRAPHIDGIGTDMGGVMYGYNDYRIRLWAHSPFIFYNSDGWGSDDRSQRSGTIRILAWILDSQDVEFTTSFALSKSDSSFTDTISLGQNYSVDDYLIMVQAKIVEGANHRYLFQSAGSAIVDGSFTNFGATVYAYTENTVYLWKPSSTSSNGNIIYINNDWGDGSSNEQTSNSVEMIVKVIKTNSNVNSCGSGVCQTQNEITYICNCIGTDYVGDYCETRICTAPPSIANTEMLYPGGDEALFACVGGYYASEGDIRRNCSEGIWGGSPLVCEAVIGCPETTATTAPTTAAVTAGITCDEPSPKPYATVLYNDTAVGSIALYACVEGFYPTSGNGTFTCDSDGSWQGESSFKCSDLSSITCSSQASGAVQNITIEEKIAEIVRILKVEPNSTSTYRRSLTCAPDPRPSSAYLGYTGIIILTCTVALLILADCSHLCVEDL